MEYSTFRLDFQGKLVFEHTLGDQDLEKTQIPQWAYFHNKRCPGNIKHQPDVHHCRLACELDGIVNYFADITSHTQGELTICSGDERTLTIRDDAQTLFYYTFWVIVSRTSCSVLKQHAKYRRYYELSTNLESFFYRRLSMALVDQYIHQDEGGIDLKEFESEMLLLGDVFRNLVERLTRNTTHPGDSARNGVVMLDNLIQASVLDMENLLQQLKTR